MEIIRILVWSAILFTKQKVCLFFSEKVDMGRGEVGVGVKVRVRISV